MPYLTANSRFTVLSPDGRGIEMPYISSAEIKLSVRDLGGSALVVIPREYQTLQPLPGLTKESLYNYIRVGYRVKLELGYDGQYNAEFTGYIRKIESGWPVKLHLDDDLYPFKHGDILTKSWVSTTLMSVLSYILPEYKIDCPDLNLSAGWQINRQSRYSALQDLKQQIGFYARIDTDNKCAYCYWPYSFRVFDRHKYVFGVNVKKNNLTYNRKEDTKLRINAVAPSKNGKKIRITVGSNDNDARVISRNFNYVSSESELKRLADKELQTISYDGYRGSITGYGLPRTMPGDSLQIIDDRELDREGVYLIDSVQIRYGSDTGYERINQLSYRL